MADKKLTELTELAALPVDPADSLVYVVDLTEAVEDNRSKKGTLTLLDTRFATAAQGALAATALQAAVIGVTVQAYDAYLSIIAGLAKADGNFIVGDGAAWTVESGATARASLGLGTLAVLSSPLPIVNGGSGQVTQQAAIDALSNVAAATNEHVLTKDTATGNAIFKASAGGGGSSLPVVDETAIVYKTGTPASTLTFDVTAYTAARVVTWPDAALTVAGLQVANVFTTTQAVQRATATGINLILKSTDNSVTNSAFEIQQSSGFANFRVTYDGHMGVGGVAASANALISTSFTKSGVGLSLYGIQNQLFSNGAAALAISGYYRFRANASGSPYTVTNAYGSFADVTVQSNATISSLYASAAMITSEAGGVVPDGYLFRGTLGTLAGTHTNLYGIYLNSIAGASALNYAIYTNLGAVRLGDKTTITQSSLTGAAPTLQLTQADLSEEFIRFVATVGAGNPIDTAALGAYYGKVRVYVEGVGAKWLALYN